MATSAALKIGRALEEVYKCVDEVTDPKAMTKDQYKSFLEDLIGDLEGRLEAVREELAEEQ